MLNDFLPAIISVAILIAVFLYAWISDMRRIRRLRPRERVQTEFHRRAETEHLEPLEPWTDSDESMPAAAPPLQ
jgi:hypothetical protein